MSTALVCGVFRFTRKTEFMRLLTTTSAANKHFYFLTTLKSYEFLCNTKNKKLSDAIKSNNSIQFAFACGMNFPNSH